MSALERMLVTPLTDDAAFAVAAVIGIIVVVAWVMALLAWLDCLR